MSIGMRTIRRAALWSLLTAVSGTVIWVFIATTLFPVLEGEPMPEFLELWVVRAWASAYFGGFIAVLAFVPYVFVFSGWLYLVRRFPGLERTRLRALGGAVVISTPFTAVLVFMSLFQLGSMTPFWSDALLLDAWVWASALCGIVTPRLLVPALRPNFGAA